MQIVYIMKWLFACFSVLLSSLGIAQVSFGYYDLPSRGQAYHQKVIASFPGSTIPASVFDTTKQEHYWDLSEIKGVTSDDTLFFHWVEGTPAAFDFPDANMVDVNPAGGNEASYFIKNETGLYFSGQSGGLNTQIGNLNLKAEFRPAVPVLKVPALQGDVVEEVSRASVDILTFGKVNLTTTTRYEINGSGTVKLPSGEEFLTMRVKRLSITVIEFNIALPGQELSDTTTTTETTYEFYTPGYGDAVANIAITFDENLGLEQYSFQYKNRREVSSVNTVSTEAPTLQVLHLAEKQLVLLRAPQMIGGMYELMAANGKVVKTWKGSSDTEQLPTQTLSRGIYVLKATNTQGLSTTHKIVVP